MILSIIAKVNKTKITLIKVKGSYMWSEVTCGQVYQVNHTRILCSAFNPSKVHTHSSEHTHTHTHTTGAAGSHIAAEPGSSWGFGVLLKGTSSWYWGWIERCTFTPPTYNSCRTWDSNLQPFDYESGSLTIRPRLPPFFKGIVPPKMKIV